LAANDAQTGPSVGSAVGGSLALALALGRPAVWARNRGVAGKKLINTAKAMAI